MPKSITPEILSKLEPYLEQLDQSWEAQPEGLRQPTLPITPDGKVNVRGIAKAIGLRQSQEQHFFRKPELASPVNALAQVQGVKSIGSRLLSDQHDKAAVDRLARTATERNDLARALAEKEAEIESLREENTMLLSRLAQIESVGAAIRTESPED
ncbi:hypothetical protein [Pseudodesulfovibrio indicus]|jgi:hypothetical protein|uniref:Uncharacterized protein n=1 Tax=Pseudodesulfovibrio indicus TaxID=1716143 RepID=A0ABM5YVB1_9BACT|nr:hypothetical protein [Pseudodesulfovibrio indicus]AMK11248.1 hypothetical protein AWY79_09035 [Pseudodesulfovibrio indicus]